MYCVPALGLFAYHFISTNENILLDTRVHTVMTSQTAITVDRVLNELSSDLVVHQESIHEAQPVTNLVVHFGNPDARSLHLAYDPTTRMVAHWAMIRGSDVVDTARSADGSALKSLVRFVGIAFAIVMSPVPLVWLQWRIQNRALRIGVRALAAVAILASLGVVLLEILHLMVRYS